jgi:Siphovirus Gp157
MATHKAATAAHTLQKETEAAQELLRAIYASHVVDDEDEALKADTIEGETSFMEAVDGVLARLATLQAYDSAIDEQVRILKLRSSRFEGQAANLRERLIAALEKLHIKSLERPTATLSLPKTRDVVVIESEEEIPTSWQKAQPIQYRLDKAGLLDALKVIAAKNELRRVAAERDGATFAPETIPGVTLGKTAQSITIRAL